MTAVVASVCNAFPEKAGNAGLALLTSRVFFQLDRMRMTHDLPSSRITDYLPHSSAVGQICDDERKKSDSLPHRRYDLETLAVKLQLTGQREQVWPIIDGHRDMLPPIKKQS